MSDQIQRELGEITSTLKHMSAEQAKDSRKLDKLDDRLRDVEKRAAMNGLVTGGITGGLMALTVGFIKSKFIGGS